MPTISPYSKTIESIGSRLRNNLRNVSKTTEKKEKPDKKKKAKLMKAKKPSKKRVTDEKDECGLLPRFCLCQKFERTTTLNWVRCFSCKQWYHVFCLTIDNIEYEKKKFICCGHGQNKEAKNAKTGKTFFEYYQMKQPRPRPQEP